MYRLYIRVRAKKTVENCLRTMVSCHYNKRLLVFTRMRLSLVCRDHDQQANHQQQSTTRKQHQLLYIGDVAIQQ